MTTSIIVAIGRNNAIGAEGDLAFHISADLRNFKSLTMGKPVIMGRKTFDSLPNGALPGRRNIVITRNPSFSAPSVETASSLRQALDMAGDVSEAMIIGGAQIYEQAMPIADKLYITEIDADRADADTYFPAIDRDEWNCEAQQWLTDEKSGIRYRFVCLSRK